jgi:GTP-binding protein
MEKLPVVAIVGRQNVGKSSLLNAMAGRRLSIVDPMPGVTRDRVSAIVAHRGTAFELVDTGGIGLRPGDEFYEEVERQIERAIEEAEVVLFLVDVQSGPTGLDRQIAARFRDKKVLLVANKADNVQMDRGVTEFFELGLGEAFPVAAVHRKNILELMDRLAALLPPAPIPERGLSVAVVGKRNVGKSTFVNALAGEERVIVSEIAGTTRDAVDVIIERDGRRFILVDTAGLRKKQKVENSVELFSRVRTEEAIERSDVVVFMLDTMEKVTEVDKRIAALIEDRKKPCAMVLNKYDLVPKGHEPEEFAEYITKAMPLLRYAPVSMISARSKERVWEVIDVAVELHAQAGAKIPTSEVNRALEAAVRMRSPSGRGPRSARIYYATQKGARPPRFIVFVNDPRAFAPDYVRYLEEKMREFLPFHEVPIRLEFRGKKKPSRR